MEKDFPWCIVRILTGFVIAPIVASISYTVMAFGVSLFFPFIFYVAGGVFLATLLIFVPVYIGLLWRRWLSFWRVVGTGSLVAFVLFFLLFLVNDQSFTSMGAGSVEYVVDGRLTTAGYINLFKGTMLVTLAAAIGSVVFWLIAHSPLGHPER